MTYVQFPPTSFGGRRKHEPCENLNKFSKYACVHHSNPTLYTWAKKIPLPEPRFIATNVDNGKGLGDVKYYSVVELKAWYAKCVAELARDKGSKG